MARIWPWRRKNRPEPAAWDGLPGQDQAARPGDPDLDLDLDGITLTAVVVHEPTSELLIRFTGGFGEFASGGGLAVFYPGGDHTIQGEVGFTMHDPRLFAMYQTVLEAWRDQALPLRLLAAPDRPGTLMADADRWIPMPRRWPPGEG